MHLRLLITSWMVLIMGGMFFTSVSVAQTAPAKAAQPAKPAESAKPATPAAPAAAAPTATIPPARPLKPAPPMPPPTPPVPPTNDELFKALDYPELQVVPSASERLRLQASDEGRTGWYSYWPVQVSSATLLATALMTSNYHEDNISDTNKKAVNRASNVGAAIGASWLIGTTAISMTRPYRSGFKKVSEAPGQTKVDRLRRERLAEEQLQYPADISRKIKYISFGTNILASAAMMPHLDSNGQIFVGISALTAFLPLIFDTTYESTFDKHQEYKRRIYVPLVAFHSGYSQELGARVNTMNMLWTF